MKRDYSNLRPRLVLKYFWQVIKQFKLSFFIVVVFTIFASVLDVYIPLQYLKLWNILSSNDFVLISAAKSVIIFVLILNLARWMIRRFNDVLLSYFEASVIAGLRKQAFSYLIGHSHNFFANNFGGSLTHRITKYARAFEKLTDRLIFDGLPLLVRGVGTVIAVYTLLPKYSLILGIFCVIFIVTTFFYIRFKLKYDVISSEAESKTTGALADSIGNHSSIQLFSGFDHEREKIAEVVEEQKKANIFNWILWGGFNAIGSIYAIGIEFLIFWLAIGDWKVGLITLPVLVLLQSYLMRLLENLWSFGAVVRAYYESFADAEEMVKILSTNYEIIDNPVTELDKTKVKGEVVFDKVTYVYENNKTKVLDNFSIKIPAGQKVAIIGTSGAGKTTFVRLLMRFFNLNDGKITIDGVDISKISQNNLRDQIGFVPQEPILFHRTLLENIRYGRRDATDEEVKEAAHLAHCDKFIDLLPEGYQTYVGERGIKLSGGERQRVAIARAILKNAPILVLDEATSSLDSESEALIQDALQKLIKGKTTIVIAHRLSTIRQMDRIVVIEKGEIVEDGTHEELTQKDSGIYKKLWELQAKGFKKNI